MTRQNKMKFHLVVQSFCFIFLRICQKSQRVELEVMETPKMVPQIVAVPSRQKPNLLYLRVLLTQKVHPVTIKRLIKIVERRITFYFRRFEQFYIAKLRSELAHLHSSNKPLFDVQNGKIRVRFYCAPLK